MMEIETLFFYILILLIVVISYQYKWKNYNWVAIITLTLVLGLRGCGIDTNSYIESFHFYLNINAGLFDESYYKPAYDPNMEDDPSIEWFYLFIIKILKVITDSSVLYFLIIDFLSFLFLDRFIQRFRANEKSLISFFFFTTLVFIQMFNAMRQFLAFMVFLNIIEYISRRDWKRYYLRNILLIGLHKSTLMLFPFYLFIHKDFLKNKILQFFIYFTVVAFSYFFVDQLKTIFDAMYLVVDGGDVIKTSYLKSENQALEMKSSILTFIFYSGTMIYVILHSVDFKKAYGQLGVIMYNFTFLGMLINNVAFNRGIERMNDYFDSFLFIVLGLMVYQSLFGYLKKKKIMVLYTYGIFLLYIAWFANSVLQGAAGCAPYKLNPDLFKYLF